ncbi:MAG: hypothetical protein PUF51_07650 [Bifidobacteriaceae bacterium]|nr:hypothetical protein [Bifidobacteriaceae bacterium]
MLLPGSTVVSDIMNGAARGKIRDGWVHDQANYWDSSGCMLATEAFAEMFAAHISTPQALEPVRKWFPKSSALFETMLKEAGQ